jgi:hypothetical protein
MVIIALAIFLLFLEKKPTHSIIPEIGKGFIPLLGSYYFTDQSLFRVERIISRLSAIQ